MFSDFINYLFKKHSDHTLLVIIILTGLLIRVFFTPHTSGSDIPQFAGFTNSFLRRSFCFYKFSSTESSLLENWPYPWPYPYGPLLLLLLAPTRLYVSQEIEKQWVGTQYYVYAPKEWITIVKSIFIFFDTINTVLIYLIVSKYSKRKAVLASLFYYLNPVTIYVSSIYGTFDSIPLALLLLSIHMIYRNNSSFRNIFIIGFLLGLALTTKFNTLYPVSFILLEIVLTNTIDSKKIGVVISGFILGALILYTPFETMCSSSLSKHIDVLLYIGRVRLFPPITYSFNGFTNLVAYLYLENSIDLRWIIMYWWIPSAILAALLLATMCIKRRIEYIEVAYTSYLIFLVTYWCIHYQYFTILVGLASIYLFTHKFFNREWFKLVISAIYVSLPLMWFFMFPTSWWAVVHVREPDQNIISVLDMLSLKIYSRETYLLYSIALTLIGYLNLVVILLFINRDY